MARRSFDEDNDSVYGADGTLNDEMQEDPTIDDLIGKSNGDDEEEDNDFENRDMFL